MNKVFFLLFILVVIFVIWNGFHILFTMLAAYYLVLKVLAVIGLAVLAGSLYNLKRV